MRSTSRRAALFAASALICLVGLVGVAWASTITQPTGAPFVVPADAAGDPVAFTVVATGFTPTSLVFVEQCDGNDPTIKDWSPTTDCELGTSPAPVIVDATGKATFLATDINHAFVPFKGQSVQGLFNCLSPSQPALAPIDGLPDYRNCRMRVSTNNNLITADQSFVVLQLPDATGATTTTTGVSTSTSTTGPTSTSTSTSTSTTIGSSSTTTSTAAPTTTSTTAPTSTSTSTSSTTSTTAPTTTTTATGGSTTSTSSTIPVTTTTKKSTTTTRPSTTTTSTTASSTSTSTTVPLTTTSSIARSTTSTTLHSLGSTSTTDPLGSTTTFATSPVTSEVVSVGAGTGGTLPRTGASPLPVAAGGLVLVIAGVGLAVGGRKRVL